MKPTAKVSLAGKCKQKLPIQTSKVLCGTIPLFIVCVKGAPEFILQQQEADQVK